MIAHKYELPSPCYVDVKCYECGRQMKFRNSWSPMSEACLECDNYKEHNKEERIAIYFHTNKWKRNIWDKTVRLRNHGHIMTS